MMNPGNMNIDFLLGLGVSPDGISPAGSSGVEEGGPLFGEMLNEMLMSFPGAVNQPTNNPKASEAVPFDKQFGMLNNPEAGISGHPAKQIGERPLPVTTPTQLHETPPTSVDDLLLSTVPTADGVQPKVDENVRAFNNELRAQLPTDALPLTASPVKMNLAIPTKLEAGSYEVIESSVADGTVNLKLADPTTRDGFIQVALPSEQMNSSETGSGREQPLQSPSVTRVDLDAMPKQTTNVERLFSQLNLKQIEVSSIPINDESTVDHTAIKLSGVKNDGTEVQLRTQIPSDQLTALKVKSHQPAAVSAQAKNHVSSQSIDNVQGSIAKSNGIDEQPPASRPAPVAEPKQSTKQDVGVARFFAPSPAPQIRNVGNQLRSRRSSIEGGTRSAGATATPAAVTTENDQLLTAFGQSLKQNLTAANKTANAVVRQTTSEFDFSTFGGDSDLDNPFANIDSIRETGKSLTGKLSKSDVRFSLPDDLASKLKPDGQSVMIRIEPDHLGPARLSLRMHQDKLSARITVETVGIKAVIEQSLDRLTQQLVKSGIDIERIEVALDGRQSGEQFTERHPHWQRQTRPTQIDDSILTETNEVNPISPVHLAAPAYVGTGGVNMLA